MDGAIGGGKVEIVGEDAGEVRGWCSPVDGVGEECGFKV